MEKLAFITGASSGIGQALALRYAQAGWRLALVARRTGEIERWAGEAGLDRQRYAVYGADVTAQWPRARPASPRKGCRMR